MTTDAYPKLFDLDDDVRGLVRKTDPESSVAAAKDVKQRVQTDRDRALVILRGHPEGLDDFALGALMGRQQTSAGKRRLELQRAGLVEYAGFTRLAPSGAQTRVWKAVQR